MEDPWYKITTEHKDNDVFVTDDPVTMVTVTMVTVAMVSLPW